MDCRKHSGLLATAAALLVTAIAAQSASAQRVMVADPTGLVLGNGGGFVVGSSPGRELEGGICNKQTLLFPGYHYMYASPSSPPGDAGSDSSCPPADRVPPDGTIGPVEPPVGPPSGPPSSPVNGYGKVPDASGAVLGQGGGVVVGSTPGHEAEAGICNKNGAFNPGYHYLYMGWSGPDGGSKESCHGDPPTVKAKDATNVTTSTATLNGLVNPNRLYTEYRFEAGLASPDEVKFGVRWIKSGISSDVAVSQNVSALQPSTTYVYRVVAKNATGTTVGPTVQFTTPAQ